MSFKNIVCTATITVVLSVNLTACNSSEPVQPPNAEQQTALDKLHKNCSSASLDKKGHLKNLVEQRRKQLHFTCDDLKKTCEANYASKMCNSMRVVTLIENAHEKACRASVAASNSAACSKLSPCNVKGFESPECQSAVAPYNR